VRSSLLGLAAADGPVGSLRLERQYRGQRKLRQAKSILKEGHLPELTRRYFVGIDWGSESHQVCVVNSDAQIVEDRKVRQSADGLAELHRWLSALSRDSGASVLVAIDVPHGAVVDVLLEKGYEVFSINPKQLDRFRDRYFPVGAKDDGRDVSCSPIRYVPTSIAFRAVRISDPRIIRLRELTPLDEELNFCF
jgi:transposase